MTDIDWREHIYVHPERLAGKPVVKGTRLSVEFLLDLLAAGWSTEQILENYPTLTVDGLRAAFAFAADLVQDEAFFALPARQG
jgi:uncharacterized protein (DUF433 family)